MHLQQTKAESRASGGPQYYFHDVPKPVKEFLRNLTPENALEIASPWSHRSSRCKLVPLVPQYSPIPGVRDGYDIPATIRKFQGVRVLIV